MAGPSWRQRALSRCSPRRAAAEGRGVAEGGPGAPPLPPWHGGSPPAAAAPGALPWHPVPGPTLALLAGNGPAKERTGRVSRTRAGGLSRPPATGKGGKRVERRQRCPRSHRALRVGPPGTGGEGAPRTPSCEMLHALGSWRSNCACSAEG